MMNMCKDRQSINEIRHVNNIKLTNYLNTKHKEKRIVTKTKNKKTEKRSKKEVFVCKMNKTLIDTLT